MNRYLARLKALNFKKGHTPATVKTFKTNFEGFEGEPGMGVLKNRELVCAQCGGGIGTDPPTAAPTIQIQDVWLHPECCRFYRRGPQ